ncbi:unnamed protein product [Paramecium pentaurelia]|uniref:Uncharacterized protein n=1 Tax=Paramecium pentaurelia TaxID=43138 RepID=A0A8S1USA3_9CILI|nr:unnamed protein product [Paramecium pentaurelia]
MKKNPYKISIFCLDKDNLQQKNYVVLQTKYSELKKRNAEEIRKNCFVRIGKIKNIKAKKKAHNFRIQLLRFYTFVMKIQIIKSFIQKCQWQQEFQKVITKQYRKNRKQKGKEQKIMKNNYDIKTRTRIDFLMKAYIATTTL